MQLDTVIFDIDGLLVDSEPLWNDAAAEVFKLYGVNLTEEQYKSTTGLRTKEFVQWWFNYFNIGDTELKVVEKKIVDLVLQKIEHTGNMMPGVPYIFDFFHKRNFKIGLATSSPPDYPGATAFRTQRRPSSSFARSLERCVGERDVSDISEACLRWGACLPYAERFSS